MLCSVVLIQKFHRCRVSWFTICRYCRAMLSSGWRRIPSYGKPIIRSLCDFASSSLCLAMSIFWSCSVTCLSISMCCAWLNELGIHALDCCSFLPGCLNGIGVGRVIGTSITSDSRGCMGLKADNQGDSGWESGGCGVKIECLVTGQFGILNGPDLYQ